MILIAILLAPLVAALVSALPGSKRAALPVSAAAALAVLMLTVVACSDVLHHGRVVAVAHWIEMDGFGALMELIVAFVTATAALYSWGYMASTERAPARVRLYAANFNLFALSILAIPLLVEPGLAWIAVGLTTLFSVLLVSFENTRDALEAAWKYMTITLVGSTTAVLGLLVVFCAMRAGGGSDFTWDGLVAIAPHLSPALLTVAFVLILVGFGAKVGLVPLHTWLPDAHSQAPSPVCAVLSGVETSAVLYVILRMLPVFRTVPALHADAWLVIVGFVSLGAAAFLILQTHDYKRLFAFSTVEHMGIILIAAGIGTAAAAYAMAWQLMTHAVAKSFCFYACGAALARSGTRMIGEAGGLVDRSKLAAGALFVGALAIAGAPLFAVFLSEFAIARAGFASSKAWIALLFLFFVAVAFFGILGRTMRVALGPSEMPESRAIHLHPLRLPAQAALLLAAVPMVMLGVWIPAPLASLFSLASGVLSR